MELKLSQWGSGKKGAKKSTEELRQKIVELEIQIDRILVKQKAFERAYNELSVCIQELSYYRDKYQERFNARCGQPVCENETGKIRQTS